MSQENKKIRHLQNCETSADTIIECSVLVADDSLNVHSRKKRKEEAEQTLYLNRI